MAALASAPIQPIYQFAPDHHTIYDEPTSMHRYCLAIYNWSSVHRTVIRLALFTTPICTIESRTIPTATETSLVLGMKCPSKGVDTQFYRCPQVQAYVGRFAFSYTVVSFSRK